ncbi:hypothetical protein MSAN_00915700 [Mycena sanguinolenta]|uniref:Uncharacterized protein n=1 Tax=Mycena sanguinolenta TaxID=230812 RepID=A0A8H7DBE1_9AGAR|nr:hypothetical protein MSAN_00915700 [Mycena sanguinolenta]
MSRPPSPTNASPISSRSTSLAPLPHSPPRHLPDARLPPTGSGPSSDIPPALESPRIRAQSKSPCISPVPDVPRVSPRLQTPPFSPSAQPSVPRAQQQDEAEGVGPNLDAELAADHQHDEEEEWHGISVDPSTERPVARKPIPRLGGSEDEGDALPDVTGLTTWAKRNPGKHIIRSKQRGKRVIGPEQRRTLNDKAKSKKQRMAALHQDIVTLNRSRSEMVHELSAKHKFKAKLVKERLLAATTFKPERKPSLFRAKLHYLSKVLNEGLERNERLSLHELRKRAVEYPAFRNMSKEFKMELLDGLEEHRLKKKTGTRATNKAVAQDAAYVVKRINAELQNLHERCGMYGFAVFSKGHVQDKTIPWILESASAANFIRESLKIDPMDLVAKFEQWCCSRDLGFTGDTLQSMRKEITRMIKDGLIIVSKRRKCAMNYERYIKAIILGYGVIIVGWPKNIDFTSPTNISSVDDMRKLRDAWKNGTAYWRILTSAEKEKWRKDYEEKVEAGEIVEVERRKRSDKGVVRGQNARTLGKRRAAENSKVRSKAVVEDEDEDEEEEEEDDDDEEDEEDEEGGQRGGGAAPQQIELE